jgi:hypothetical protein
MPLSSSPRERALSLPGPAQGGAMMARSASMWRFDPVVLGRTECDAWVGYYLVESYTRLLDAVAPVAPARR